MFKFAPNNKIIDILELWWINKKGRTAVDELMPTLIINKHVGNKPEHDKSDLVYDFVSYRTI